MTILFLVNEYVPYYKLLVEAAAQRRITLTIAQYDDIHFTFTDHSEISLHRTPLESFEMVYFRTVQGYEEEVATIAKYRLHHTQQVLDPVFTANSPYVIGSKLYQHQALSAHNLPTITTLANPALDSLQSIEFPCVAKASRGKQGEQVYRCNSVDELKNIMSAHHQVLVQPLIQAKEDYRLFVVGDQVVAAMRRQSQSPDEFRHNISQGAIGYSHIPQPAEIEIAVQAAKALGYAIAGVDLIFDETRERWLILEVNKAPQLTGIMTATEIDVPGKIVDFLQRSFHEHSI